MNREDRQKVLGLGALAQMVLDGKLSELRQIARARDENLARLEELNRQVSAEDLNPIAAAEAEMRYQRWADQRRSEINQLIAQQNVAMEEARSAAQTAFGRAEALRRIAKA